MEHLLIGAFSLPRVFTLLCLSIHVAFVNYVFMFRGIFTSEDFFDYSSIVLPLRRFYESHIICGNLPLFAVILMSVP